MLRLLGYFLGILLTISTIKVDGHGRDTHTTQPLKCYFIFGDSLSDAGNNDNLKTKATANYLPYGIDFLVDGRPTGRFSNGHTAVDFITSKFFKDPIAPFSTARDDQIMNGVNYASGSAGICPETGEHLGDRVSLDKQLENHKTIVSRLGSLTKGSLSQHLESCLYTINIGSNDYINNYFLPEHYNTSRLYNRRQFADRLISHLRTHLKTLHENGARKIAIFGMGQLGCALAEVVRYKPKTLCVDFINSAVLALNLRLRFLVRQLNKELPNSHFVFIDVQAIKPSPLEGIKVFDKPCCTLREDFQCKENERPCNDRNAYLFWDGFHLTSAANKIIGEAVYKVLAFRFRL